MNINKNKGKKNSEIKFDLNNDVGKNGIEGGEDTISAPVDSGKDLNNDRGIDEAGIFPKATFHPNIHSDQHFIRDTTKAIWDLPSSVYCSTSYCLRNRIENLSSALDSVLYYLELTTQHSQFRADLEPSYEDLKKNLTNFRNLRKHLRKINIEILNILSLSLIE